MFKSVAEKQKERQRKFFDISIGLLCSGDVDLLESIRLTKNLGKKVIVCSSWGTSAKAIRKEADAYIDLSKLSSAELDQFTII